MSTGRIETLRKKRDQLNARIKDAEARERQKKRKEDTRRKIIAGALALEHMAENPDSEFAKTLGKLIFRYVKKPKDRELFDLPPVRNETD